MRTIARTLVALLLLTTTAQAALIQKGESFNGANNVTSHSAAMASITSGSAIVVGIIAYNSAPPTITISGGGKPTDTRGNVYSEIPNAGASASPRSSPTHFTMRTFYCLNSTSGANTVSVALSANVFGLGIWFAEVPATASTYFLGSISAGSNTANPALGNITGNSASGLMLGYVGAWTQTYTAAAGWTFSTTGNGNAFIERDGGPGTFAATISSSGADDWVGAALSFSPVASATYPSAILIRNHPVL